MEYEPKREMLSTINSTDETDEATEDDPCLPSNNSKRKSMESISKNRDLEENNSSVLESEKNKNNENANSYSVKSKKTTRFKAIRLSPSTSEFEKWATEKTGLSRAGLITLGSLIVALFVLFLIVLIMAVLWPSIPHSLLFPICRTPPCLLASSEVISKMNQSVSPCEDLREYACGHWFATHSIPKDKSSWDIKQHMQYKHRENLRNFINTMQYPDDTESLRWRVKNMYDSCISVGAVETEEDRPLRKIFQQLGGWHILKDFSVNNWEMRRTLMKLHSKFNVQPFFKVEVVPDAKEFVNNVIQITPSRLGLPSRSHYFQNQDGKLLTAYLSFLKDVALTFGATSDAAKTFSMDMYYFEKRVADGIPSRLPERVAYYRPTIAKLEEIAPSVPFFDILSSMFPEARLSKKSEVVVIAADHLVNVSRFFSSTDKSVMNDFMMLKLAVEFLQYLSKPFRNTLFELNSQLYGIKESQPRWEMCIETLQKFVGFGLEAMLEEQSTDGERKRRVVTDIFEQIRGTVADAISKSNNLPPHIQDHFMDKLNNIGIQVGLPVSMKHETYYNSFYRSLTSIKHDFFQNVMYGISFLLEEQQKRLTDPAEEHRWIDIVSDGKLKVVYVPEINKVIVPLSLLSTPYFHPHYPSNVLYGGIGAEIALAILSSITGQGLFHSGDGIMLPPEHPLHNKTHECFIHHPDITPHLEAVKFAFIALQSSLTGSPHLHQPAIEYLEDPAIFFVAYAQSLCSKKTSERLEMENIDFRVRLDDTYLLMMLKEKSKEFSSAFSCGLKQRKDTCDSLI